MVERTFSEPSAEMLKRVRADAAQLDREFTGNAPPQTWEERGAAIDSLIKIAIDNMEKGPD